MAASHSQTLTCSVPSFVVSDGPHTTYLVVTLLGFSTLALHDELSFELPRLPHIFPAAKMLLSGLPQVKRRRVGELDSYLRLAASLAGTSPPSALLGFLGVDDLSQASAGEAQLRAVIAAAAGSIGSPDLFVKRVVGSGSGSVDAVGGDQSIAATACTVDWL